MYQGGALRAQVEIRTAEQKAGRRRVRARRRSARSARSRTHSPPRTRCAIATPFSRPAITDNERALELARIQYRVGSVDLRAVEQSQLALYCGAHLAPARADRAAGAARQPAPRAGRRLRPHLPTMEPVAAQRALRGRAMRTRLVRNFPKREARLGGTSTLSPRPCIDTDASATALGNGNERQVRQRGRRRASRC